MEDPIETTPLLSSEEHPHSALFDSLDCHHSPDHIHDHPPTKKIYHVRKHLTHATLPAGHGHPMHHHMQSPALLLRLTQAVEHGFSAVLHAIRAFFKTKAATRHLEEGSNYRVVLAVFIIAVLTMATMTSISPTLLLYMNHVGFTTPTDISLYVIASALSSAVPIVSNIILGMIASRFGPGRALSFGALVAAAGICTVIFSRNSAILFFLGYGLYASCNSLRVIRVSILTKVVPEHERTTVLATHALMTPIGALLGPLVWIGFQMYRGSVPLLGGAVHFNRFFLAYVVAFVTLVSIAGIATVMLNRIVVFGGSAGGTEAGAGADAGVAVSNGMENVTLHYANGDSQVINLEWYKRNVFRYFCGIMFGVNLSAGFFMTAFQPVLINVFHTSDAKLGLIFELVAIFAIVPPLLVALLSKYLKDRQILVIGLISKILGMALFLPLFGPVREWQVIAGFLLIIKASIFFSTASMSLFTKLLGSMSTSSLIGLLASGSNIGPAVAQIALADHIVKLFGSFRFGLFAIPAIISLVMIVHPKYWRRLNPEREFNQLLQTEVMHSVESKAETTGAVAAAAVAGVSEAKAADLVIIAALPNPVRRDRGNETVTLRNRGGEEASLQGWELRDQIGRSEAITGTIAGSSEIVITLSGTGLMLNNEGDDILLVNPSGEVAHVVSYSAEDVFTGQMVMFD